MTGLASRAAYDPVAFAPSNIAEAKIKLAELKRSLS
jgi:hypothetical protein